VAELDADVIVIGLGAWGSSALWRLAASGISVLGLEQFGIGHSLGSTHGSTRVFRVACLEHPDLVPMALRSRELWRELETATGRTLLTQTGALMMGAEDSETVVGTAAAAASRGMTLESFTAAQLRARFPAYTAIPDDAVGLWDGDAGLTNPEAGIAATIATAISLGATALDGIRVSAIEEDGDHVVVRTAVRDFRAGQVVMAAGAWNAALAPELPFSPRRTPMFWFEPAAGNDLFDLESFPVFCREISPDTGLWGHGATADHPVKLGLLDTGDHFSDVDPDTMSRGIRLPDDHADLSASIDSAFAGLPSRPASVTPCIVTNSPDRQFVIGRHPGRSRIVVAGGDSGHGHKHAPAIGELIAQLIMGVDTTIPSAFVSPARFS
jgi:sarcosine oxidase